VVLINYVHPKMNMKIKMLELVFTHKPFYMSRRIFVIYREAMPQGNDLVFCTARLNSKNSAF
jgi:hypothetical protein